MSTDLNREVCAKCGVRLTDRTTVVENDGTLYCCGNCLAHDAAKVPVMPVGAEVCAHCGLWLIDTSTRVVRGTRVYCCGNCANAMVEVGPPA
jgi:predicted RNA-binding Zn-ribbon protein involved in translation (DUF1610 family)